MSDQTPRPWCCPEPRCAPIVNHGDGESLADPRPGQSFTCLGQMDRDVQFTYDGNDHRNDLNRCVFTPLKGILRYQENAEDWRLERTLLRVGLTKIGEFIGDAE